MWIAWRSIKQCKCKTVHIFIWLRQRHSLDSKECRLIISLYGYYLLQLSVMVDIHHTLSSLHNTMAQSIKEVLVLMKGEGWVVMHSNLEVELYHIMVGICVSSMMLKTGKCSEKNHRNSGKSCFVSENSRNLVFLLQQSKS